MNIVNKGSQKVNVASRSDAIALMGALNEYGSTEPVKRQEVIGKDSEMKYKVIFDNEAIAVCELEDAEMVTHWLMSLNCKSVTIERS